MVSGSLRGSGLQSQHSTKKHTFSPRKSASRFSFMLPAASATSSTTPRANILICKAKIEVYQTHLLPYGRHRDWDEIQSVSLATYRPRRGQSRTRLAVITTGRSTLEGSASGGPPEDGLASDCSGLQQRKGAWSTSAMSAQRLAPTRTNAARGKDTRVTAAQRTAARGKSAQDAAVQRVETRTNDMQVVVARRKETLGTAARGTAEAHGKSTRGLAAWGKDVFGVSD